MNERYARQILMEQIDVAGQERLARAAVVVVGAGGLGSPALTYLAAAGVGRIGLIDGDTVELTNLNRQFLHGEADLGRPKADSARERLAALNGTIEVRTHDVRLTEENAAALLAGYDLILGAVDSFETRAVINRAAIGLGIPYIDGGVNGFSGSVFYSYPPDLPCLNCVFPLERSKGKTAGVLGTTAGVIGTAMANVALLHLLGLENPLCNKLFWYDGLRMRTDLIEVRRDEGCLVCGSDSAARRGLK
ncbi:MAG: HesA/MoeB/ThiF family protein [Oscillospiraceae bacterium]|nr:HesA/MoeB/ThiF family protein [Oscillospiraceae bacterium]